MQEGTDSGLASWLGEEAAVPLGLEDDQNFLPPSQEEPPGPPSSVFVYHQGEDPSLPKPGPLTSISEMSGSSEAQGRVGEAGGTSSASGPLSSVVESVPEESVGSVAARLSSDTLVQAEDLLRFRHQCIGLWDIRGSTLCRRNGQGARDTAPVGPVPPASLSPHRLPSLTATLSSTLFVLLPLCCLLSPPSFHPPWLHPHDPLPLYLPLLPPPSGLALGCPLLISPSPSSSTHGGTHALLEAVLGARTVPDRVRRTHPWNDTAFFFFVIPLAGVLTPSGASGTSSEWLSTPAGGSPASWISLDCQIVLTTTLAMACGGAPAPGDSFL